MSAKTISATAGFARVARGVMGDILAAFPSDMSQLLATDKAGADELRHLGQGGLAMNRFRSRRTTFLCRGIS